MGGTYSSISPNDISSISFRPGKRAFSFSRTASVLMCEVPQSAVEQSVEGRKIELGQTYPYGG
jgi:hypothetical protein